jgi:hypothetical protein
MFEDKRRLFIIIGAVVLIIIVGLGLWWFLKSRPQPTVNPTKTEPVVIDGATYEPPVALPPTPERIAQENNFPLDLKQLAMSFAERYGSYSSDEPTKNFDDLKIFMTIYLAAQIKPIETADGVFSGISTRALSTELLSNGGTKATVLVKTQRAQTVGTVTEPRVYYQDLQLSAVKVGSEWKIDAAVWQ